ncbi:hypothetical protein B0H17DRAFT_1137159 [Mycena rosella]|uniref:Uncharacterized protein n=1 Tax=Mycena rosella TaxID=1033263 RepID=A0AAD7GF69_MYCRO|nr:hypothetical protein B0H17DRAFT_1137159 [Mycena rosella]
MCAQHLTLPQVAAAAPSACPTENIGTQRTGHGTPANERCIPGGQSADEERIVGASSADGQQTVGRSLADEQRTLGLKFKPKFGILIGFGTAEMRNNILSSGFDFGAIERQSLGYPVSNPDTNDFGFQFQLNFCVI